MPRIKSYQRFSESLAAVGESLRHDFGDYCRNSWKCNIHNDGKVNIQFSDTPHFEHMMNPNIFLVIKYMKLKKKPDER